MATALAGTDLTSALVTASKSYAQPIAAAYAAGNRVYHVQLQRPGDPPTFDRNTGQWTARQMTLLYDGPARIFPSEGTTLLPIGDEEIPFNATTITLDYFDTSNAPDPALQPRADDVVTLVDDAQAIEGHIPSRTFEVIGVAVGGHIGTGWVLQTLGAAPSRHNPGS